MKLPVSYNSNFQIQDSCGNVICDLWRNPHAVEDGARIVESLNSVERKFSPGDILDMGGNGRMVVVREEFWREHQSCGNVERKKLTKAQRSEMAREMWRKRRQGAGVAA